MSIESRFARLPQLWRYYQVGMINTVVGFGLYALFVWLGLDKFLAQIVAHLLGMAFNYFTYARHVFYDAAPAKARFVAGYALNYLLGLGALAGVSSVVTSPYLAGAIAVVLVSIVNYFVLKYGVFARRAA